MALQRCAKQEREAISALFDRRLSPQTVDLLVHGGFTASVFQRLRKHELPTLSRVLNELHIKLSDQEREAMEQCAEWNSIPVTSGEKYTFQGGLGRPDEQDLVNYRQWASDKDRYLFEYLTSEGQASNGQDFDIEAGWGASQCDQKQYSDHMGDQTDYIQDSPLFLTKEDSQLNVALEEINAESDPDAEMFDRLIVNAAMATRELNSILKAGASDRPRQRKTFDPSRVLFVRS